jgi:hypothetical protein
VDAAPPIVHGIDEVIEPVAGAAWVTGAAEAAPAATLTPPKAMVVASAMPAVSFRIPIGPPVFRPMRPFVPVRGDLARGRRSRTRTPAPLRTEDRTRQLVLVASPLFSSPFQHDVSAAASLCCLTSHTGGVHALRRCSLVKFNAPARSAWRVVENFLDERESLLCRRSVTPRSSAAGEDEIGVRW